LQAFGIRLVADHGFDFGIEAMIVNAINNGLQITAATGY
jgi:hypothetical protein